jgi:hypothetical protein
MATRELNLPGSGERRLPVQPREVPLPSDELPPPADWWSGVEEWPAVQRLPGWMNKPNLEAVFCETPTRQASLIAAGVCALLAVLVTVLSPRRQGA